MGSISNCSPIISSIRGEEFDFIIVGGGTAGLVLANRLTEDPNVRVLVVEAGAERLDDPQILTPGMVGTLPGNPKYDWDYQSEPQEYLNNRIISQARGRVLGGSSAINFSLVLYPSNRDLDSWAKLGNKGWSSEEMAPYFRKISTNHPPSEETKKFLNLDYVNNEPSADGNQGGGPLQLSYGDEYTPANKAWVESFGNLGYRMSSDPSKGSGLGAFTHPASIDPKTKTRSYAANAYYTAEVAGRTNLQVLTEAHVEKVLLDGNDTSEGLVSATGIRLVTKDENRLDILAKEEVILCAGTLHSPKILELSGIGGKDLLESHDIPVVVDNANVGENMQDHTLVSQSFEVNDGVPSADLFRNPDILNAVVAQYQATREGPMGASTIASSYMPLVDGAGRTTAEEIHELLEDKLEKYPDFPGRKLQYQLLRETLEDPAESSAQYMLFPSQINIRPTGATALQEILQPVTEGNYITFMTMLNRQFSRGNSHIQSSDTRQKSRYDPKFCSHELDLEVLARHVQFLEKLVVTEPMTTILKKDGRRIPDIQAGTERSNLDAAREIVRQRAISVFHISGTCAMMPRESGGVVDDRLVVYGTKNLRVVDASIFPLEPLGNIQTTVYAAAEKAADIIKENRKTKNI